VSWSKLFHLSMTRFEKNFFVISVLNLVYKFFYYGHVNPNHYHQAWIKPLCLSQSSSSSCMHVMNHNWSATKQRLHLQSVAEISRHLSFVRGHYSTVWDIVWVSSQRHRSVSVSCENGSSETTVAEGGRNPIAGLWGHTLGENWPPEPTSQLCLHRLLMLTGCKSSNSGFLDVSCSNGGLRISGWIGQLSCSTIFSTSLSVAAFLRRAGG